jgi:hypothetical protein
MKKIALILCWFLLSVGFGHAANYAAGTYYIDFTLGSDASADPTNIATPWKTLDMINGNTFSAPTTIALKKGETWNGFITIPSSGTLGNEFTLTSYGTGAKPIIKRTGVITDHSNTGWTNVSGVIWSYPLTVGTWLYENGKMLKKASDATLADGSWWSTTDIVYYKAKVGSTPADNLIEYCGSFSMSASDRDYIVVDGIQFTQGSWFDTHTDNRTNITIRNCDFTQLVSGPFLSATSHIVSNVTISSNTFSYNDTNMYLANGNYNNAVIQDNVITYSNQTYWGEHTRTGTNDADGISLQGLTNSTIQRNDISGGCWGYAGIFIWHGGYTETGNVITRNYIHDVEGGGIIDGGTGGTQNVTISYNIIKNFGTGDAATYSLDNIAWGGIRADRAQSTNSLVANNTIYNGDVGFYLGSLSDYYTIKNNIVHTMSAYFVRNNGEILNNIFDNNIYYPGSVGTPFYVPSAAKSWAQWQAVYTETNSLTSDPSFTSTSNFYLLSGSPAINAGANVSLTTDYAGRAVPYGAGYDIGAYEFGDGSIMKIGTGAAPKIGVGSAITVY